MDVQPFAPQLLDALLAKIGVQNSLKRTSENDFLMRCACAFRTLRVVSYQCPSQVLRELSAKQALVGEYVNVLQRLVRILREVAPNPSNPNFDQYIFESISGHIRFIDATVSDSIAVFESALCALPSVYRNFAKGHRLCVISKPVIFPGYS